jgi:hypothetical protein
LCRLLDSGNASRLPSHCRAGVFRRPLPFRPVSSRMPDRWRADGEHFFILAERADCRRQCRRDVRSISCPGGFERTSRLLLCALAIHSSPSRPPTSARCDSTVSARSAVFLRRFGRRLRTATALIEPGTSTDPSRLWRHDFGILIAWLKATRSHIDVMVAGVRAVGSCSPLRH